MSRQEDFMSYFWLVRKIAHGVFKSMPSCTTMEPGDLIGAGSVGLLTAIDRVDVSDKGFKYYAQVRIRGEIYDEIRKCDKVGRAARTWYKSAGIDITFTSIEDGNPIEDPRCPYYDYISYSDIRYAVNNLPKKNKKIVEMYHFEEIDQTKIGSSFGVLRPRISQILTESNCMLKTTMEEIV